MDGPYEVNNIEKPHRLMFVVRVRSCVVFADPVYATGKKDRNRTGPDRRLRLCAFQIEGPRLCNRLQPVWLEGTILQPFA